MIERARIKMMMRIGTWLLLVSTATALVAPHLSAALRRRGVVVFSAEDEKDRNAQLLADIERFRSTETPKEVVKADVLDTIVDGLGVVLSINFVVIVVLFSWFLWGVFSLYALENDATITLVKASFDPIILPILSTHMALTFLSAGLERLAGRGQDAA